MNNKLLVAIFLLILIVLLVGAAFGFRFAGGEGYFEPMPIVTEIVSGDSTVETNGEIQPLQTGKILTRGQTIHTGNGARVLVRIGERITIALDQRTDVVIEKLFPSEVEIKLIGGRLLADTSSETEKLIISSPKSSAAITDGAITAVRYDFLNKTSFTPIGDEVSVDIPDGIPLYANKGQTVDVNEKNPMYSDLSEFNWQTSSDADFFNWVIEVTGIELL